jgi:putative acetyltransferase
MRSRLCDCYSGNTRPFWRAIRRGLLLHPIWRRRISIRSFARLPGSYAPPDGRLLLALGGEQPAGCVALHRFGERACEMKRMWVRPEFRGCGLGRRLAEKIVAEAQVIGYERMLLDTLPSLENALGLYCALGFREVAPYRNAPDPKSVFMELKLSRG